MENKTIIKTIDAAFEKGKHDGAINLNKQGIRDAGFFYLLTKETQKVVQLILCTF